MAADHVGVARITFQAKDLKLFFVGNRKGLENGLI